MINSSIINGVDGMGIEFFQKKIIATAKMERVVYEHDYRQNPELAAEIILKKLFDKKVCIFPNTEHSKKVCNCLYSLGSNSCEIYCEGTDVSRYDAVALIGYWTDNGVEEFCRTHSIEKEQKIFLPYREAEMILAAKSIESDIDSMSFPCLRPELVLILTHEARDFITHSAFEISKNFRLTKIYIDQGEERRINTCFDQVVSFRGNIKSLEYFFKKWSHCLSACAVFTHGIDFWKIPYISSLMDKQTKLITLSCDWFSMIVPNQEAANIMKRSVSYMKMEEASELFSLKYSDAVITNFRLDNMLTQIDPHADVLTSYSFMSCDKFVFQKKEQNESINYCFAGSLISYDFSDGLRDYINLSKIFEKITKDGSTIDIYEAYGRDLSESQYGDLIRNGFLNLKPTAKQEHLPKMLSKYDYGLIVYNMKNTLIKSCFDMVSIVYQSKLITYLSAGIPVVISSEFEAMAKIVRRYNCGIVVSNKDIELIPKLVKEVDYKALKLGVSKFQDYYMSINPPKQVADFLLRRLA